MRCETEDGQLIGYVGCFVDIGEEHAWIGKDTYDAYVCVGNNGKGECDFAYVFRKV